MSTFLKAKTEEKLRKKKMVDPQKRAFLSFEIKKTVNKIFFIFFVCSSFNNKRLTNVMLISIFLNSQKNVINCQKAKMAFLMVSNFFLVHFQKYQPKNICATNWFFPASFPQFHILNSIS